ncbi:MAG: hypothetical protein WEC59_07245 [Salibacteraceae bacterium]
MKNINALLVLLTFALCACNGSSDSASTTHEKRETINTEQNQDSVAQPQDLDIEISYLPRDTGAPIVVKLMVYTDSGKFDVGATTYAVDYDSVNHVTRLRAVLVQTNVFPNGSWHELKDTLATSSFSMDADSLILSNAMLEVEVSVLNQPQRINSKNSHLKKADEDIDKDQGADD